MQRGQLLNHRYRLSEVIGGGRTSVVWRAHDEVLNRSVAVKILARSEAADGFVRGQMLADAQAAATITHPNLVAIHDYGETPWQPGHPQPFIVMELLTGWSLADPTVIDSLTAREAIKVCAQVAAALTALHERGVVHGAMRPSNVILTEAGAKVVDFGIAALTDPSELDEHGQHLRRPAYVAPERILDGEVTAAADVYALGVLIYRLLAHELPWPTDTSPRNTRARLLGAEPNPLPLHDDIPIQINDLYRRCLNHNPEQRPTADEAASTLQPTQAAGVDDDIARWRADRRSITTAETSRTRRRRRRTAARVAGAVGLVAATVAVLGFTLAQLQDPSSGVRASNPESVASGTSISAETNPTRPGGPGTRPASTDPPASPATTAQDLGTPNTAPPATQELTAVGGTVTINCQGNKASVQSVHPAAGFTATTQTHGPPNRARVVLASTTHESDISARCGPRGLVPTVNETPLGANP